MNSFNWDVDSSERNNFLARIMGIFGEKIAGCWFENEKSGYDNLGRPTIHWTYNGQKKWVTLDFLINKKESGEIYLVEQKNFFAYQEGKLRKINNDNFPFAYKKWSDKKKSGAWEIFTELSKNIDLQKEFKITTKETKDENHKISGTILIWSDVDESYKNVFCAKYGFSDIIGLTQMIKDLNQWEDHKYIDFISEKERWIQDLFNWLKVK